MFSQQSVKELFGQYVLARLWTGPKVPASLEGKTNGMENLELERARFGETKLPLYGIVRPRPGPDGQYQFEVVDSYAEGKINSVEGFKQFLRAHLPAPAVASRNPSK